MIDLLIILNHFKLIIVIYFIYFSYLIHLFLKYYLILIHLVFIILLKRPQTFRPKMRILQMSGSIMYGMLYARPNVSYILSMPKYIPI